MPSVPVMIVLTYVAFVIPKSLTRKHEGTARNLRFYARVDGVVILLHTAVGVAGALEIDTDSVILAVAMTIWLGINAWRQERAARDIEAEEAVRAVLES